jgi:hypothetical protein
MLFKTSLHSMAAEKAESPVVNIRSPGGFPGVTHHAGVLGELAEPGSPPNFPDEPAGRSAA